MDSKITGYFPIESLEKEFHHKPTTLGNYKKLRLLTLKNTSTPLEDKLAIVQEFKLATDEITDNLGVEDFYKEVFYALFLESRNVKDLEVSKLNIGVLNKALIDFFMKLKGS